MSKMWTRILAASVGLAFVVGVAPAQPYYPEPLGPEPFGPEPQAQTRVIHAGTMMPGGSYLGVGLQEVDGERSKALKLKQEEGVEITHIEDDSPAAKAGLKKGDVILQYNGQHVDGIEQFSRMVHETPAGREAKLLISRDGAQQTVAAKIGARKIGALSGMPPMPRVEIPSMPDMPRTFMMWRSGVLGIEGESLRGQLADYFGVKEGVLVRSVMKDTPAEKAGIKAGDVILKVSDVKVASPGDISNALRTAKPKTTVTLQIIRDKHEMTLTVAVEGEQSGWDSGSPAIRISGQGSRM